MQGAKYGLAARGSASGRGNHVRGTTGNAPQGHSQTSRRLAASGSGWFGPPALSAQHVSVRQTTLGESAPGGRVAQKVGLRVRAAWISPPCGWERHAVVIRLDRLPALASQRARSRAASRSTLARHRSSTGGRSMRMSGIFRVRGDARRGVRARTPHTGRVAARLGTAWSREKFKRFATMSPATTMSPCARPENA